VFSSVLVANRGEIAVRICKTLRNMGIRSVVVASIPDRRSLAVRTADDWVLLEGYSAAESYLDIDAVIAAAKDKGCEAIHPGYGFLSERADFAERCAAEGITFIGPPPVVLRALGDKSEARRLAVANGVPVVPGWDGADDDATLIAKAGEIGLPIMIKARGGGGGRGMRPVHDPSELPEAIESARREAEAAFGDPGLLVEKLVTSAHHVEVQVLADTHGNVIHLGERDCSVQRRRQKLIEETPSPVVDDALREQLTAAALRLARAVAYVNAGTFEFLVGEPMAEAEPRLTRSGRATTDVPLEARDQPFPPSPATRPLYFLEVNPRLQVEHPVTEMVTGLDLVELQLRVAAGEELPLRQEDVTFTGHAIEFRINAEDPWNDFRPSSGRIEFSWLEAGSDDYRLDAGFAPGDLIPTQYDSLLAKCIFHGPDRDETVGHGAALLGPDDIVGPRTNLALLTAVARSEEFRRGDTTVDWLEPAVPGLLETVKLTAEQWMAAAVGFLLPSQGAHPGSKDGTRGAPTIAASWVGPGAVEVHLDDGTGLRTVSVSTGAGNRGIVEINGRRADYEVCSEESPGIVQLRIGPQQVRVSRDSRSPDVLDLYGTFGREVRLVPPPPLPRRAHAATEGATAITAPLAGTIASVRVADGDTVQPGDLLLTLDAMKMEHRITATSGGTVASLHVAPGDVVREGDVLVELA
jgi:acetyl/propionyl-CoA carboxylase alpha subunit